MKRFLIVVIATCLIWTISASGPAFAQTPAPLPTFTLLSGTAVRDASTHRVVGNFSVGYGKDLSTSQRAYAVASFWSTPGTSGGSGGAAYDLVAWDSGKGTRLIFGGDGEIPVGGIDASLLGIVKIGIERQSRSLRGSIFLASVTPINPGPTGNEAKMLALNFRLAFLNP